MGLNTWTHVVFTGSGSNIYLYLNGVQNTSASAAWYTANGNVFTGKRSDDYFGSNQMYLDEVRISKASRSADWIQTEYNNQSSPSTFYQVGYASAYSHSMPIVINHAMVSNTDQYNFPLLIQGTYTFLSTTGNGGSVTSASGYDIVFSSDPLGQYPLPFEQESYNGATGNIVYWVQVGTLSHTNDTTIYMFYGSSAVTTDQSNKNAVWDSNYIAVWHLPETITGSGQTVHDSKGNSDLTSGTSNAAWSSSDQVAGQIDGSLSFAPGDQRYLQATGMLAANATKTVSIWVKPTHADAGGNAWFVGEGNSLGDGSTAWGLMQANTNFGFYNSGYFFGSTTITPGQWYFVSLTYNSSDNSFAVYLNGSSTPEISGVSGENPDTNYFYLGADYTYGDATLDETEISSIVRSPDWIQTEYNNQSSPSTFFQVPIPVVGPTIPAVSSDTLTAAWTAPSPNSVTGFDVEASTASDISGSVVINSTTNTSATAFATAALSPDTTYYIRVGALYNGTTAYANTTPASTSTLTSPVTNAQIYQHFIRRASR